MAQQSTSGTTIYINESLTTYYKNLSSKCKTMRCKHILWFSVRNSFIRVKLKNETISIITHDSNLTNLLPDNPIIGNYLSEQRCSSHSWLQSCYFTFSGINSEPCHTSRKELFSKTIKDPWLWAAFAACSVLDFWMGFV